MNPISSHIQDLTADIMAGIVDGVVVTDAGGHVLMWNRAAEELTGIAATDAVGKNIHVVFSDNPAVQIQIEKTFSSGRSYSDYEIELVSKHRPPLPVGFVTSMLTDSEGKPMGVILSIRDQAGVRDLKERMRRSDRLATLGMIAAGIAHEIKNPLVGIRGAAQLMKSELRSTGGEGSAASKSLIEYLNVILKEADRLNKVLEGILDFTRLKPREIKAYNIHSILDRVLLLHEEIVRQNNVILTRLYDPSLPDIIGNQDQLIQVFLNIIKNAIEAMPTGGRITVITRMSDLFTSVQADGKKHRLMVTKISDTGRGITQEHLTDIFTPFFTTKDKGVGLGLALSYQIVQEHLGTIRVESSEKEGTTFSVYLPLAG
ncbi:MAG TPA: ATP-binding protein [Nitrospirota bacterium]|nr:ATP-binding protein [Nitrospirota bacterium]